jgi:hypothetical protein
MSGAIPALPTTPSWSGAQFKKSQENFTYYLYYYLSSSLLSEVSFPLVLLLSIWWYTPPFRLQVSDGSTFLITRVYPKVSGLVAWSENCKWYSESV